MCLIQEGTSTTHYVWHWGDNSSDTIIGYKASQNVDHTYSFPGLYSISVKASEDGETFDVQRSIIILGGIKKYMYMFTYSFVMYFRYTF